MQNTSSDIQLEDTMCAETKFRVMYLMGAWLVFNLTPRTATYKAWFKDKSAAMAALAALNGK